jgi:mannosyltransferase OCH1-like enzyme
MSKIVSFIKNSHILNNTHIINQRVQLQQEQIQIDQLEREQSLRDQLQREQILRDKILRDQIINDEECRRQLHNEHLQREKLFRDQLHNHQLKIRQLHDDLATDGQLKNEQIQCDQASLEQLQIDQLTRHKCYIGELQCDQQHLGQLQLDQIYFRRVQREQLRIEQLRHDQEIIDQLCQEERRLEKLNLERIERDQKYIEQLERDRVDRDRAERDRSENDRAERDRAENDRAERDRAENDRAERDRAENDRSENIVDNVLNKLGSIIPLNIYQFWHSNELPSSVKNSIDNIKRTNPEFTHTLVNEETARHFIKDNYSAEVLAAYDCIVPYAIKADLWRYCVLYKNGGVYLDVKYSCMNKFKFVYLTGHEYFCKDLDESGGGVYNALIVCKAHNNIMLRSINRVVENVKNKFYGQTTLEPTGPMMLKAFFPTKTINGFPLELKGSNNGLYILYKNCQILAFAKHYRSQQQHQAQEHWSTYWHNKTMYSDDIPTQYKIEAFAQTYNALPLCKIQTTVLVSRYNNTTPNYTTKLNKYNTNIIMYDVDPPIVKENKVHESSAYLKYIIESYYNLSEFTFFIHANEYSWCHTGSIEECFLKAITSTKLFYNINQRYSKTKPTVLESECINDWYKTFVSPYMQFADLTTNNWIIDHKGVAQFLVHKNLITRFPREFYMNLYNWIQNCPTPQSAGCFLEFTWKLFCVISNNSNQTDN